MFQIGNGSRFEISDDGKTPQSYQELGSTDDHAKETRTENQEKREQKPAVTQNRVQRCFWKTENSSKRNWKILFEYETSVLFRKDLSNDLKKHLKIKNLQSVLNQQH